jgi:molybdenum cofactor cytidylyltransferase
MKESIARGLDRIAQLWSPAPHDAWLVAPADLPLLSAAAIDQVLAAHEPLRPTIVVPQCGGRRGHPVLFPWELAAEVGLLPPDAGVNDLLRRHPPRAIDCAAAAFADDIDTPEDYRRLQSNPPRPH